MKYLTFGLDWLWNLKALEGARHKVFRWVGIGIASYQVLATAKDSPFEFLPDVPEAALAAFLLWLSTKGIEFAKAHPKG